LRPSIAGVVGDGSNEAVDHRDRSRIERARTMRYPSATLEASVIVPTHARPERLAELVLSMRAQTLPAERFELVVIDDGSPPGREPRADGWPDNARLIRQRRAGPAAARNAGAAQARGRLLAFIDDDCMAEPDWLAALLRAHREHPLALLGGTTLNGLQENLVSDVAESLLGFLEADERRAGRPLSFLASNNLACGRDAFAELGGFDTSYPLAAGEDRAFCRSWRERGGELLRVADATVLHRHAHDIRSFWRQQRNYGRGAALFHAAGEVPAGGSGGLPRERAFYARLLLHYARRADRRLVQRLAGTGLLLVSQAAIARGLLAERLARRGRPADTARTS